jgi:hypothetical protein
MVEASHPRTVRNQSLSVSRNTFKFSQTPNSRGSVVEGQRRASTILTGRQKIA